MFARLLFWVRGVEVLHIHTYMYSLISYIPFSTTTKSSIVQVGCHTFITFIVVLGSTRDKHTKIQRGNWVLLRFRGDGAWEFIVLLIGISIYLFTDLGPPFGFVNSAFVDCCCYATWPQNIQLLSLIIGAIFKEQTFQNDVSEADSRWS